MHLTRLNVDEVSKVKEQLDDTFSSLVHWKLFVCKFWVRKKTRNLIIQRSRPMLTEVFSFTATSSATFSILALSIALNSVFTVI